MNCHAPQMLPLSSSSRSPLAHRQIVLRMLPFSLTHEQQQQQNRFPSTSICLCCSTTILSPSSLAQHVAVQMSIVSSLCSDIACLLCFRKSSSPPKVPGRTLAMFVHRMSQIVHKMHFTGKRGFEPRALSPRSSHSAIQPICIPLLHCYKAFVTCNASCGQNFLTSNHASHP